MQNIPGDRAGFSDSFSQHAPKGILAGGLVSVAIAAIVGGAILLATAGPAGWSLILGACLIVGGALVTLLALGYLSGGCSSREREEARLREMPCSRERFQTSVQEGPEAEQQIIKKNTTDTVSSLSSFDLFIKSDYKGDDASRQIKAAIEKSGLNAEEWFIYRSAGNGNCFYRAYLVAALLHAERNKTNCENLIHELRRYGRAAAVVKCLESTQERSAVLSQLLKNPVKDDKGTENLLTQLRGFTQSKIKALPLGSDEWVAAFLDLEAELDDYPNCITQAEQENKWPNAQAGEVTGLHALLQDHVGIFGTCGRGYNWMWFSDAPKGEKKAKMCFLFRRDNHWDLLIPKNMTDLCVARPGR